LRPEHLTSKNFSAAFRRAFFMPEKMTPFCHRELAAGARGDPARWIASSLHFSQ
jgi:hypothetical protein